MNFKNLILLRTILFFLILSFVSIKAQAQSADSLSQKRIKNFCIYGGLVYAGSLLALNELWYADYPRTNFNTFNDNAHWLQVDKFGHLYSAFTLSKLNYAVISGSKSNDNKQAVFVSTIASFAFLTSVEVFDGFSQEWGFSWGDMAANALGSGLFLGQQILFDKQVLQIKYAYHETELRKLRPATLGENKVQGAFKDYNGQTYWASLNLNGVYRKIKPKWLNIAFGYGGGGMLYATNNSFYTGENSFRQYYFSMDVDFEQIETNSKWLKAFLKVANCIKVPAPTIELNENGDSNFYWIYF